MALSKKSTALKPILISTGALLAILIIVFAGFAWRSQVNELKNNKNLADQKISELEKQLNGLNPSQSTEEQRDEDVASKFVSDFYESRIGIVKSTQGRSGDEQSQKLKELEAGKVTSALREKLDQPQDGDIFFCVKDPVMSFTGVKITKLETSFNAVITIKVGDENDNSEVEVKADLVKSGDSFKFDSLECTY